MLLLDKKNILHILKTHLPYNPIIIEAGAFKGDDTVRMAQIWPEGSIYAFEPMPDIFAQLYNNTKAYENIYPIQLALSDNNGTAQFWPSQHPTKQGTYTQASSLLAPKERLAWSNIPFTTPIQVQTITLSSWANNEQLTYVDLVWLDVQGYELPIMQASTSLIKTATLIYVEVHFIEAYQGQALYPEVKTWLESIGFTMIGKDFADQPTWFFGTALFINNRAPENH